MALAHDDRSPAVKATMILFLCMTWITFSMRSYVRLWVLKAPGLDDLLTLISLLLFTTYGGFVLYAAHWGTGKHVTALTPDALENALMGWWYCEVFYILCTAVLKCAVGAFILRVATQKPHRLIIWGLIGLNIVFNIYYVFSSIFQCFPVSYFWTRFDPSVHGHCVNPRMTADSTYAQSGLSILTDWVFGILPIFIVWNLKMSKEKRISVALVLGLGTVASTATIVRVPYLVTLIDTKDFLFATVDVAIWSTVEPGIGITAVSVATLRPLFRSCLTRVGLASRDYMRSNSYPEANRGYAQRKASPFGVGSQRTMTSNSDSRMSRAMNRRSTSFLDDESPERDVETGLPLSPLSPRAAARMGDIKNAAYSSVTGKDDRSSPNSGRDRSTPIMTRLEEVPEPERVRTVPIPAQRPQWNAEQTFAPPISSNNYGRPPSRNFSRPNTIGRSPNPNAPVARDARAPSSTTADMASFFRTTGPPAGGGPRPPSNQENMNHMNRTAGFSYI